MRIVKSNTIKEMGLAEFEELAAKYQGVVVDVGTGDGKFVYREAQRDPTRLYIGIDSAAGNLEEYSTRIGKKPARGGLPNVLYIVAFAEDLPVELNGVAEKIHVNYPWGSLLQGVVLAEPNILSNLRRIAQPGATLEMMINYSLFSDPIPLNTLQLPDLTLEYVDNTLTPRYAEQSITVTGRKVLYKEITRAIDTTWAKRLAFGREPRTVFIQANFEF